MAVSTVLRALTTAVVMAAAALSLPSKLCRRSIRADSSTCPMNTTMTMTQESMLPSMYPGLFMAEDRLDSLFNESFTLKGYRKVKKLENVPCGNGKCYKSNRFKRDNRECCDTETNILQLISVEKDGMEYTVANTPSGSQYFSENACASEESSCSSGKCKSLMGLHWVLVYDPNLAYYPPVKFVMVEFKMGCSCQP